MIPDMGARTPTRMRLEGGMCNVVLPKRTAVDVIVVKPMDPEEQSWPVSEPYVLPSSSAKRNGANHQIRGTKRQDI